jgi:hypothetical protein
MRFHNQYHKKKATRLTERQTALKDKAHLPKKKLWKKCQKLCTIRANERAAMDDSGDVVGGVEWTQEEEAELGPVDDKPKQVNQHRKEQLEQREAF